MDKDGFLKYLRKLIDKVESNSAWFTELNSKVITNAVSYDGLVLTQERSGYRITSVTFGETDE